MIEIHRPARSLEHTRVIAHDLSAVLRPGDVVKLVGELGAGKTTFVRMLADALGADESLVSSPTFVIMNLYPRSNGHAPIAHLDCYRLGDESELDALGWDQVIGSESIVLVEWPDRIEDELPEESMTIRIGHVDETSRDFSFSIPTTWSTRAGFDAIRPRPRTTCPTTGQIVEGDCLTWPFASEQARMADLNAWFEEKHTISRPVSQSDIEEGE